MCVGERLCVRSCGRIRVRAYRVCGCLLACVRVVVSVCGCDIRLCVNVRACVQVPVCVHLGVCMGARVCACVCLCIRGCEKEITLKVDT